MPNRCDAAVVSLVVEAGPDAGRTIRLPPGRFLVGRARGVGRIADPSIEAHHLSLQIDPLGAVAVTQLAGRVPAHIDDDPIHGVSPVVPGSVITIGATRILLHGLARYEADDADDGGRADPAGAVAREVARDVDGRYGGGSVKPGVVSRRSGPPTTPLPCDDAVRLPDADLDDPARVDAAGRLRAAHVARVRRDRFPWQRCADDPAAFVVALGVGRVRTPISVADSQGAPVTHLGYDVLARLERHERQELPVVVDLAAHDRLAIVAADTVGIAVVRSVVAQLAHRCGPSVWQLLVADRPMRRRLGVDHLPHLTWSFEHRDRSRLVVIADLVTFTSLRPTIEHLRTHARRPVSVVVIADSEAGLPADIVSTLAIGSAWRGVWRSDRTAGFADLVRVHVTGVTEETARRSLAPLRALFDPDRGDRVIVPRRRAVDGPITGADPIRCWHGRDQESCRHLVVRGGVLSGRSRRPPISRGPPG